MIASDTPSVFWNKRANASKLLAYGFCRIKQGGDYYRYHAQLLDSGFMMQVEIRIEKSGTVIETQLLDPALGEPYTLHLAEGASGSFVGTVRMEYEQVLEEIAEHCFDPEAFDCGCAGAVREYVRTAYGDELEFLWKKSPGSAIWRRKDTQKWYAVLMQIPGSKLGLAQEEKVEVIDLRGATKELEQIIDGVRYFPGYHMNKKHWYTMLLDGSVPAEEICRRLDESYLRAIR